MKLGPLRNTDVALLAGFLSTLGLIIIATLGLTIYGYATFQDDNSNDELQSKMGWNQFKGGFLVGAFGGSGFAYICLLSIPTFS